MKKSIVALILSAAMITGQICPAVAAEQTDALETAFDIVAEEEGQEAFAGEGEAVAGTEETTAVDGEAVTDDYSVNDDPAEAETEEQSEADIEKEAEAETETEEQSEADVTKADSHDADPNTDGENYSFDSETGELVILDKKAMDGLKWQKSLKTAVKTLVIRGNDIDSIPDKAFSDFSGMTGVTFEAPGLTTIGYGAFQNCSSLTSMKLPDSVTSLGTDNLKNGTFYGCSAMTDFDTGDGLTYLPYLHSTAHYLFKGCSSLKNVRIGKSVSKIGKYSFYQCAALSNVDFSDAEKLTAIDDSAFYECTSLSSLSFPDELTTIGKSAFYNGKGLIAITLGSKVESIGESAFFGAEKLTSISFNECLTTIDKSAFKGCKALNELILPDDAVNIGDNAFDGCKAIQKLKLPANLTIISQDNMFKGCTSLKEVIFPAELKTITGKNVFDGCTSLKSVVMPDKLEDMGKSTFNGCTGLLDVTLSPALTEIPDRAFAGCSSLNDVIFAENGNLTTIGAAAFKNCTNLTEIALPDSVTSLSTGATSNNYWGPETFSGCTNLESFDTGDGLEALPATKGELSGTAPNQSGQSRTYGMFYKCSSLKKVRIGKKVTSIGWNVFADCSALNTVDMSEAEALTSIGECSFQKCSNLTSITIPATVTSIGAYAFGGDQKTKLAAISGGDAVNSIGDYAFYYGNKNTPLRTNLDTQSQTLKDCDWASWNREIVVPVYHNVSFDTDGAGAIEPQSVLEGTYAAKPEDPEKDNCVFDDWFSDEALTTKWDFDIDTVTADTVLYARWRYSVTIDSSIQNGTLTADVADQLAGGKVTLTATPDTGYKLKEIKADGVVMEGNEYTMTKAPVTFSAVFEEEGSEGPELKNITIVPAEGGSISANVTQAAAGTVVKLTATADTDYEFDYFTLNGVKLDGDTFEMPAADVTVSAVFSEKGGSEPDLWKITVDKAAGGALSADKTQAEAGTVVKLTATPDAEYELEYFTLNGVKLDEDTFEMPASDVRVGAVFKKKNNESEQKKEEEGTTVSANTVKPISEQTKEAVESGKGSVDDTVGMKESPKGSTLEVTNSASENRITVVKGGKIQITNGVVGTFNSTEPKNVKVNKKGLIKAKRSTTSAVISYKGTDGNSYSVKVTVLDPIEKIVTLSGNVITKKLKHEVSGTDDFDVVLRNIPINVYNINVSDGKGAFHRLNMTLGDGDADKNEPDDRYYHLTGKALKKGKATVTFKVNGKKFTMKVIFKG